MKSLKRLLVHIVFPIAAGIVIFIPIFICTWFLWLLVGFSQPLMDSRFVTILVHLIIPAGMLAVWVGMMRYIFGSKGDGETPFSRFAYTLYLGIVGIALFFSIQVLGVNVNSKLSQTMVKCTQKVRHRETRNIEPHFAQGNIVYHVTSLGSVSRQNKDT